MTWADYALARQYVVEESIGSRLRDAKRQEDAEFNATRNQINRRQGAT